MTARSTPPTSTRLRKSTSRPARFANYEAPGATFLNDVTVHKDGRVFVSDMLDNQIWVFEDGTLSLWLDSKELDHPNGLLAEKDRLVVASWANQKKIFPPMCRGG